MAEKVADKIGQIPPRYAGVATQIFLGTSTLLTSPLAGTTYAFIESRWHIPAKIIGLLFIATGVIAGVADNKWVYWFGGVGFFVVFSLVSFGGALNHQVSFQAGIAYLGLAVYGILTFPRGERP